MAIQKAWAVSASVGGKYPGVNPVFFPTQKNRLAVATALAIKIYQLSNQQVIAKIPIDCTDLVQFVLNPEETKFYLVRKSGTVDIVDVDSGEKSSYPHKLVRIVDFQNGNIIALYNKVGVAIGVPGEEPLHVVKATDLFSISNNRQYVAFGYTNRIETFDLKSNSSRKFSRNRDTTVTAISNSGLVAAAAPTGVIDVYYGQGIRTLKWHLSPVEALTFSLNDEYLISGGNEKVLVFWQMDADKQQFLPRLDGSITGICTNSNSTLYAVTLDAAQMILLSATDLLSRLQVSGVRAAVGKVFNKKSKKHHKKKLESPLGDFTVNAAIHPSTNNIYFVTPGTQRTQPGSRLQIYNPMKDEQETAINVASSLPTGKVRSEETIKDPSVTHVEFTADGKWMITVDTIEQPEIDKLLSDHDVTVNLKFWWLDNNEWKLVTRVVNPHDKCQILSVKAHSSSAVVLTAGSDGSVRSWRPSTANNVWQMRRVAPGFACTSEAVAVSWSMDGSVFALGFEMGLYLYDAHTFKLHSTLPNILGSRVRDLWFCGKYLVCMAKSRLVVWDVVCASQVWSIKLNTFINGGRLCAIDRTQQHLAIAVNYVNAYKSQVRSILALFDVSKPIPLAITTHSTPVSALALVPGTSQYMFVDARGIINTLGGTASAPVQIQHHAPISLYTEVKSQEQDIEMDEDEITQNLTINSFDKVFTDEANLDTLFDRVLQVVGR